MLTRLEALLAWLLFFSDGEKSKKGVNRITHKANCAMNHYEQFECNCFMCVACGVLDAQAGCTMRMHIPGSAKPANAIAGSSIDGKPCWYWLEWQ